MPQKSFFWRISFVFERIRRLSALHITSTISQACVVLVQELASLLSIDVSCSMKCGEQSDFIRQLLVERRRAVQTSFEQLLIERQRTVRLHSKSF